VRHGSKGFWEDDRWISLRGKSRRPGVVVASYTTVAPLVGERVSTQYAKLILENLYLLSQRATDGAQLAALLTYLLDITSLPGPTLRGRESVLFTLRRFLSGRIDVHSQ
jgi:hypothetical protein